MGKIVKKKLLGKYYDAVVTGAKTFELRKDEDDIQEGDILILSEWNGEQFTGRHAMKLVRYVLRDCLEYGLMPGFCIISLWPIRDALTPNEKRALMGLDPIEEPVIREKDGT